MGRLRFCHFAFAATFAAYCIATPAGAGTATVVDWGGEYVTAHRPFARTATPYTQSYTTAPWFEAITRLSFSETAALNPSAGYSGASSRFYGGYEAIDHGTKYNSSSPTVSAVGMFSYGGGDAVDYRIKPLSAGTASLMLVWLKPDFLDFSAAGSVCLDSGETSISVKTREMQGFVGRILVRDGGSYFISDATFSTTDAFTLTNPSASALWAPFDPAMGLNFDQNAAIFSARTFVNVTGVGVYFEADEIPITYPPSVTAGLGLTDFTVIASDTPLPPPPVPPDPTGVPTPSAAFAGLVLLAGVLWRRRAA